MAYDPWILKDHPPGKHDVEPWKKVDEQDCYHAVGSPETIE